MLLEGFGRAADFAIDNVVRVRDAGGDGAADEVFANEVDYAGYFADLGSVSVGMESGGEGEWWYFGHVSSGYVRSSSHST